MHLHQASGLLRASIKEYCLYFGHFLCNTSVREKCTDVRMCLVSDLCSYRFTDGGNICTDMWSELYMRD